MTENDYEPAQSLEPEKLEATGKSRSVSLQLYWFGGLLLQTAIPATPGALFISGAEHRLWYLEQWGRAAAVKDGSLAGC